MIIADLDGVFADFTKAACTVHGKPKFVSTNWDFYKEWGLSSSEFWEPIHRMGNDFYKHVVQPYPWAVDLIRKIEDTDDFIILSSPSDNHACYSGKKIWIELHLQPYVKNKIKLMVGADKHLLAGANRLLLDDNDDNIKAFSDAGGYTLRFPQLWNRSKTEPGPMMGYLHLCLNAWKGNTLYGIYDKRLG